MKVMLEGGQKLRFAEKMTRLRYRLQDPEWRKYFKTILAGKALGMALLLSVIVGIAVIPSLLSGSAHAQTTMPGMAATAAAVTPADAW